ncbi:MAG: ABC transporter ATP-binding protein [Spirochaetota bacterium]
MSTPIVAYQDIAFAYHSQSRLLTGVSFALHAGRAVALLGPNGVGKTTLLRIGLGWLRPRDGTVLVQGRPVQEFHRRELGRTLALVPQDEHLPFDYSLKEYVLLGRTPHLGPLDLPGEDDRRLADAALVTVGLSHIAQRSVAVLSAGERQLLLLARAIAQAPQAMLLDEPSSHLDIGNKSRVMVLLRRLRRERTALLFTTHDPQFAINLADTVIVLKEGHVMATGSPAETITSSILARTYEAPVEVVETERGRAVFWGDRP